MEKTRSLSDSDKKTYSAVDLLKFVFCIFIIALHTHAMSVFSESVEFYSTRILFRLAVPYFFVTSGFFLRRKYRQVENQEYRGVLFGYVKRLLYPYVIFSVIWMIQYWTDEMLLGHGRIGILKRIIQYAVFYPKGAIWFVQALIVSAFLTFVFVKKKNGINLCIAVGVILYSFALLCNNYYFAAEGTMLSGIIDKYMAYCISARNGLFVGLIFFSIGMKCYDILHDRRINRLLLYILTASSFVVYVAEVFVLRRLGLNFIDDGSLYISQLFLTPCLLLCSVSINIGLPDKASILLRNLSTGMYYLHRPVLWMLGFYFGNSLVLFLITALTAFGICLLSYKIEPQKKYYLLK